MQVVVDKTKANNSDEGAAIKEQPDVFEEFCESLPENDCRYAVFDLLVETADGRTFAKVCHWDGSVIVFVASTATNLLWKGTIV